MSRPAPLLTEGTVGKTLLVFSLPILFVSLYVLRIPFAVAMLNRLGADAIWWSYIVGSSFSILLTIAYYRYGGWRNARMLAAPLAPAPT